MKQPEALSEKNSASSVNDFLHLLSQKGHLEMPSKPFVPRVPTLTVKGKLASELVQEQRD